MSSSSPAINPVSSDLEHDATESGHLRALQSNLGSGTSSNDDIYEQNLIERLSSSLSNIRRDYDHSSINSLKDKSMVDTIDLPVLTEKPPSVTTIPFDKGGALEDCRSAECPPSDSTIIQQSIDPAPLSPTQLAYHNKRTWIYFCTCVWCLFTQGWHDGSTVRSVRFTLVLAT
jgi:hypothetical protein